MPEEALSKTVCGVNQDIIERALILIRDKYPLVDKANYFLETHVRTSGINIAITNQRDAISHLITILPVPTQTREDHLAQITAMEEHLRRGIVDSYQKALEIKTDAVLKLFGEYKSKVLTSEHPLLTTGPDARIVEDRLREIRSLLTIGRTAKARNRWDTEWESGCESFVTAYHSLDELRQVLEQYLLRSHQLNDSKRQTYLHWVGIVIGVLGLVGGLIFFVLSRE